MIRIFLAASAVTLLIAASAIGLRAPTAQAQQTSEPDFRYGYGVVYDEIITADAANAVEQCEALRSQLTTESSARGSTQCVRQTGRRVGTRTSDLHPWRL